MKKFFILPLLLLGFATVSVQAGQEVYKQVAPPPPQMYGLGFYGAIDMGANIYQNRGGTRTFTDDNPNSHISPFRGRPLVKLLGFGRTGHEHLLVLAASP